MAVWTHRSRCRRFCLTGIAWMLALVRVEAVTVNELLNDPKLTPKRFAKYFEDFTFDMHPFDVQNPAEFLSSRSGNCIDYAVLADHILKQKGYETRLIRVEMVGKNVGHAICYVAESRAYLDFNSRKYFIQLERSGPTVREIAVKVVGGVVTLQIVTKSAEAKA